MANRSRTTATVLRALFARSSNQCAFPGCIHTLLNSKNEFVAQICHIEAAKPGGERYNPTQNEDSRRAYANLVILCYQHHIETNDVHEYPVEKLKKIKSDHENKSNVSDFKIDERALYKIAEEMTNYWETIEQLNTIEHACPDFAVPIDAKASYSEIMGLCKEYLEHILMNQKFLLESDKKLMQDFHDLLLKKQISPSLFEDIPYWEHPFGTRRNWETHNLALNNWMIRLKVNLMHLEIKYYEEFLKTNSKDLEAISRMENLKMEFSEIAQNAGLAD